MTAGQRNCFLALQELRQRYQLDDVLTTLSNNQITCAAKRIVEARGHLSHVNPLEKR